MTVYTWCYKWYEGAIIGFLGVILYCLIGGLEINGMPGWTLGNLVICLLIGIPLKYIKKMKNKVLQVIITAIIATIAAFIGIELIKSVVDSFVVSQPIAVRFAKNLTSFIADAFMIVASLSICALVNKTAIQLRNGQN